jgi:hypothetical protein
MRIYSLLAVGLAVMLMVLTGTGLGQGKPACDSQGKAKTPERVAGQVAKVDLARGTLSVREPSGAVHEFQAAKETLEDVKVGDPIHAKLREAPQCP